jgi:hypothetical protein
MVTRAEEFLTSKRTSGEIVDGRRPSLMENLVGVFPLRVLPKMAGRLRLLPPQSSITSLSYLHHVQKAPSLLKTC